MHVESNHPPNIMKQILKTIEKRFSQLSPIEEIFNESAPLHGDKLHQSGYQQKLKYNPVNSVTYSLLKYNPVKSEQKFTANVTAKEI